MKKTKINILIALSFILIVLPVLVYAGGSKKNQQADKIEVLYFHYTHRCATCLAVEAESQKAVMQLYPKEYKAGIIVFKSINLDDNEAKVLAEKYKAEGQALLITGLNKRFDITDKGFMYARNNADKLKAEIRKVIDTLLVGKK